MATLKKWLTERGCRFDTQPEGRGEGYGTVTIHRQGRRAMNSTRVRFAE